MKINAISELEDKISALQDKIWDNTLDDDEPLREVIAEAGATCTLENFEKMNKELRDLESKLDGEEK